jgi:hypothetical protein
MTDCEPNPGGESAQVDAALFCTADDGRLVAAYHFFNSTALNRDVEFRKRSVTGSGKCENGQDEAFGWNFSGPQVGTAVCFHSQQNFVIFWTYDAKLVGFQSLDKDPTTIYQWWRNFDPVPQ